MLSHVKGIPDFRKAFLFHPVAGLIWYFEPWHPQRSASASPSSHWKDSLSWMIRMVFRGTGLSLTIDASELHSMQDVSLNPYLPGPFLRCKCEALHSQRCGVEHHKQLDGFISKKSSKFGVSSNKWTLVMLSMVSGTALVPSKSLSMYGWYIAIKKKPPMRTDLFKHYDLMICFTPKKWCTHKSHQNSMTRTMSDIYHISYIMYV